MASLTADSIRIENALIGVLGFYEDGNGTWRDGAAIEVDGGRDAVLDQACEMVDALKGRNLVQGFDDALNGEGDFEGMGPA